MFKLLDTLILGNVGGFPRDSQVDGIVALLFKLVRIAGLGHPRPCGWHCLPEGLSRSRDQSSLGCDCRGLRLGMAEDLHVGQGTE